MSYQNWKVKAVCEGKPNHEENCIYKNWSAPIDECPCDCYGNAIYEAGRESMRQEVMEQIERLEQLEEALDHMPVDIDEIIGG